MSRLRRALPWIWTGVLAVWAAIQTLVFRFDPEFVLGVVFSLVAVGFAVLGSLIMNRQPGNGIAWILFAMGLGAVLSYDPQPPIGSPTFLDVFLAATANVPGLMLLIFPALLLFLIFPDGHFLGRRWALFGWTVGLLGPLGALLLLFSEELTLGFEDPWTLTNPFGFIPAAVYDTIGLVYMAGLVLMAPAGVTAMVIRYRSADLVLKAQIKWVLLASATFAISFVLIVAGVGSGQYWFGLLFIGPFALIAIAVAIAITRYKLFEIDRIISRSVTYAMVAGLLALVFAAGVTWIPSALGLDNDPLLVAGSTLAVAALFNPIRKRVQSAVDRRFNRSRYEAQLVSERFATRLQDSLTVNELAEAWTETVDQHLQPEASGVWLRDT